MSRALLGLAAEVMTLCLNCTQSDGCSGDVSRETFHVPIGRCFSPPKLFPGSKAWGASDTLDICSGNVSVKRTFYASTDGSCTNETDSYTLDTGVCLGPFGMPRPWGVFTCP